MDKRIQLVENLIKENHDTLIKYCISLQSDSHSAEDFVFEAYRRMWENIEIFEALPPKAQIAWLYTTISNLIRDDLKKKKPLIKEDDFFKNIAIENNEQETFIENDNYEYLLKELKQRISIQEKELLMLIIEKEKTYDQIAEDLKINSKTLRTRVRRLRKKLTPIIEELLQK